MDAAHRKNRARTTKGAAEVVQWMSGRGCPDLQFHPAFTTAPYDVWLHLTEHTLGRLPHDQHVNSRAFAAIGTDGRLQRLQPDIN